MALVTLDLEPLYVRRDKLCLDFEEKTLRLTHGHIPFKWKQYTKPVQLDNGHNAMLSRWS